MADYGPSMFMSAHGFNTHAHWQKQFAAAATSGSTKTHTEPFDYGRFGFIALLIPGYKNYLINRFYSWYHQTVQNAGLDPKNHDTRPSIVAHSLGTWIVGNAMLKHADIVFDKVIFCGSILPRDFDWARVFARDQVFSVRNEFSPADPWPRVAKWAVTRAGDAGAAGFDWYGSAVRNVEHDRFGHSDSLLRAHIESTWMPFLRQRPSPLLLIHGRDINEGARFTTILDDTNVIDKEAYGALKNYREAEIPRGLSTSWIRVNPDIYTFLIDRSSGKPAGYLNAMPVEQDAYERIKRGEVLDNGVQASDVSVFERGQSCRIYIMSLAVGEQYRRWGDGILQEAYVQLVTGFIDKLSYYWRAQGVRVTHLLATAWTPEGEKMCRLLGMSKVSTDKFGDPTYELDLSALDPTRLPKGKFALKRLLATYASAEAR